VRIIPITQTSHSNHPGSQTEPHYGNFGNYGNPANCSSDPPITGSPDHPILLSFPRFPNSFRSACMMIARLAAVSLLCCASLFAQKPGPTPPPTPQTPVAGEEKIKETPHELTASDVSAFLDGFMPMQLEREDIAGAVVLVVKDGKVLFAKGYGYSDVEKKKPVTVDSTLFRPGSISKLFTWTAVMQLVQQGNLDLDRDINDYLDFKIPATFPQPITLRNIMTHTPGFEETVKKLFVPEGSRKVSLKEYLTNHIPARIFPPGAVPAYSNYGATLAGYIVERVSGKEFNAYITENIFKPLGMEHSSFAQPLPDNLKPLMSNGYELGSGKSHPFEIVVPAPAGSLSSTAADLSHFMIAHLQDGKFEQVQILSPETAQQMHSRQKGFNPELNAMALGFYEENRNGHHIIGHGGDTIYFHSDLHLVLDSGVGFFVSYNSAGKGQISGRTALWQHFLDRYFPFTPPEAPKLASAKADARTVSGYYLTSRRPESNLLKVMNAFSNAHVVPDGDDGGIKVIPFKDFNGQIKRFREIRPLVYRDINGQDRIAFQKGENGRLEMRVGFPAIAFQRISWFNTSPWNTTLVAFAVIIMALVLLLWPVAAVIRRHYGWKLELTSPQRISRRIIRLVCAIDIAFFLGLLLAVLSADDLVLLSGKLDPVFVLIEIIGLIGAIGTLLVIYAVLRVWRDQSLWRWTRALNLLILLACLGFTWFLIHWNLINFNLKY
jgi:CubicO group peptidase (beta-lactamase class C family)